MAPTATQGELPGRRLLPKVLDLAAHETPNRLYATIPAADDLSMGYRDITFDDLKERLILSLGL